MPKKDKMLLIRKNISLPESEQKFVWNACYRADKTKTGHYIVPIKRCFGCPDYQMCEYLAFWKSPALNSKNREVLYCRNYHRQPE